MFWHLVENMNITKYISIKNIRLRVANIFYLKILMLYFDLFSLIPELNFVLWLFLLNSLKEKIIDCKYLGNISSFLLRFTLKMV